MGAAIALSAIFLPSIPLVYGTLPFWNHLRSRSFAQAGMRGANAGMVGILAAAFYHPVWTSAILSLPDFAIALVGFLLLTQWKLPPWIVVFGIATASTLIAMV